MALPTRQPAPAWRLCVLVGALLLLPVPFAHGQSGSESSVGYIDDAIPTNQFRLRVDSAFDNNEPDRAEFFWSTAKGPPLPESSVNYQEVTATLEGKLTDQFSAFVEAPWRFIEPQQNADAAGFSDLRFGFKWAFIYEPDEVVTFQLRTYVPTGNVPAGLGTGHYSLEPSLLLYKKLTERLTLEGQFGDWIPIGDAPYAGDILEYGLGLSYHLPEMGGFRITPVTELFGWTVLSGRESLFPTDESVSASGDTIINLKVGVRIGLQALDEYPLLRGSDFYIGYGRALTGDVWYKDLVRVEYRLVF